MKTTVDIRITVDHPDLDDDALHEVIAASDLAGTFLRAGTVKWSDEEIRLVEDVPPVIIDEVETIWVRA